MNRQAVAQEILKIAKVLTAGEVVIATNYSSYRWEDFSNTNTAKVFLDESTGKLRLLITGETKDESINPYQRSGTFEDEELGTLDKPRLGNVAGLLKKHNHDRTSAGGPFSKKWTDRSHNQLALGDIIRAEAANRKSTAPSVVPAANKGEVESLLKEVDLGTIEVENATTKVLRELDKGDHQQIEHSLGALDAQLDQLIKRCNDYKKLLKK
jgi:hypothetical protein